MEAAGRTLYDFVLHCALAFSAMAMWSESQIDRIRDLTAELDFMRRERKQSLELDRLTGLFNQAALARRVEEPGPFEGVVAVCDADRKNTSFLVCALSNCVSQSPLK